MVITKQEQIDLIHQTSYWKAQHAQLKEKVRKLEESNQPKDAKIKAFGKKSEKTPTAKSGKSASSTVLHASVADRRAARRTIERSARE